MPARLSTGSVKATGDETAVRQPSVCEMSLADGKDRLRRIIRPQVLAASAYQTGDPGNRIKLDAMENPYPLPDSLRRELSEILAGAPLNRYPDPSAQALKQQLRTTLGLPSGQPLLLGNGSDELIQLIAMAVAGTDVTLMAPEPGFAMYRLIAAASGCRYSGVPLAADDFALDADAMLAAIDREQPAVIFIAWPNNPTGNLFDRASVEKIIATAPGLVVVDEAYHAFAGDSFLPALADFDNLVVLRTLSKLGLAGLRIGIMAGTGDWIEQFDKLRLPYNVGVLNQIAAATVLAHHEVLDKQVQAILKERERLLAALEAMPGIRVWPSVTNFLLFRTDSGSADNIFRGLLDRGVLIKNLHGSHPLLENCLRVTVGMPEENDRFLEVLRAFLD